MLICYLDDSGKDPQNSVTTLAGYVATNAQWEKFETAVEPWFSEFNVKTLHAKDLHATKGEFCNWTVLKKEAFVARICKVLSNHIMLGMSMSLAKDTYKLRAKESDRKYTSTSYTFCFAVIIDWILRDIRTGRAAHCDGVSLKLEEGHENNQEAVRHFKSIISIHKLENVLRSISFVPKGHSRAIQMADLLAFYTRRHAVKLDCERRKGNLDVAPGQMMKIIAENAPIRAFVATDFGPNSGSPFLADHL